MKFPHGEFVTRHPFVAFEDDSWGEGRNAVFGGDETVGPAAFDLAEAGEPRTNSTSQDSTVTGNPTLYLEALTETSAHDEWTIRGLRYEQDGEASHFINPFTGWDAGWVVKLKRRAG